MTQDKKSPYVAPAVVELGAVASLTLGLATSGADNAITGSV